MQCKFDSRTERKDMANDLTFTQTSAILNEMMQQATGQKSIAPVNTEQFVSVAQTALLMGYDRILNALSQVMSRTIFSSRPYTGHMNTLRVTDERWGNHVRKINYMANDFEDDQARPLENLNPANPMASFDDGNSFDQWKIKKPKVIQTNFYGGQTYQDHLTFFRNQLNVAFSGPSEYAQFVSGALVEMNNKITQKDETFAKMALANYMGGLVYYEQQGIRTESVVHLLTEYNNATGLSLTRTTVMQPGNYDAFIKWAFPFINNRIKRMANRGYLYHTNLLDYKDTPEQGLIPRHTPMNNVKTYIFDEYKAEIESRVLADTYHDNYIKLATNEGVTYFQNQETPDSVIVTPAIMETDGTFASAGEIEINNIFGLVIDEEAVAYKTVENWQEATPINAAGGYSNTFWHWTDSYWNDFTENGILFLFD